VHGTTTFGHSNIVRHTPRQLKDFSAYTERSFRVYLCWSKTESTLKLAVTSD